MIKKRGIQLLAVSDAYQLREIAEEAKEWNPNARAQCPSCSEGGGPPVCAIRDCCKVGSLHVQSATKCFAINCNHKFKVIEDISMCFAESKR
jgi:hypothetical protein